MSETTKHTPILSAEEVDKEFQRLYGYFRGENPDRAKVREILDTEPMARWLAIADIRRDLETRRAAIARAEGRTP